MQYDIALSFAGEDREYVEQVANYLRRAGVAVFYDKYEQVDLWGKDLYEHLSDVYRNKARFTVMFVSRYYAEKLWTRHERKNAQARAFRESTEYILPVRFDDTEVPGLPETVGYLDLRSMSPSELAEAICAKLVRSGVALTPPPVPASGEMVAAVSPTRVTITARGDDGQPVSGADLMLVAANRTHLRQRTDAQGRAQFDVAKRRTLTVFCAHPSRPAFLVREYDPIQDLSIVLPFIFGVGSLISVGGWDQLPGLRGEFSPIHDSSSRLYVYTKNLAVNGGQPQPVTFVVGTPLHVEDPDGNVRLVTFAAVIARCFLVEHQIDRAVAA